MTAAACPTKPQCASLHSRSPCLAIYPRPVMCRRRRKERKAKEKARLLTPSPSPSTGCKLAKPAKDPPAAAGSRQGPRHQGASGAQAPDGRRGYRGGGSGGVRSSGGACKAGRRPCP